MVGVRRVKGHPPEAEKPRSAWEARILPKTAFRTKLRTLPGDPNLEGSRGMRKKPKPFWRPGSKASSQCQTSGSDVVP